MGRAKREVPTGKLMLKYPKTEYDKSKAYTLYFYYSCNRTTITKDTGYRVKVSDWNPDANNKRGALRSSYGEDFKRCNNRLDDSLRKIDEKLKIYNDKHPNRLTPDIVRSILFDAPLTRDDEGKDFVEYVKEVLKKRLSTGQIQQSRYENGLSAMNMFQQFLRATNKGTYKADSIYLGEISRDLIDDYIDYRRNIKKNRTSTINHSLTPIIIACEHAYKKHYIKEDVFEEIEESRLTEDLSSISNDDSFDGKYLSKDGLTQLLEFYENDVEQRRKEYIEMFLFAFHSGGMRIVDVMTLEWKHVNFKKRELRKVLIKTLKHQRQRHTVPLTDPAIQILNKWQEMGRRTRFVFDLLNDDADIANQEVLYKLRNSATKKVNQALNVVGEKMKLPFKLTFHVARHSFAINALNDEDHPLDMYQVSRLLGHTSTEVTEKVYAEYTKERLEEKMKDLNFNFVPNFKKDKD